AIPQPHPVPDAVEGVSPAGSVSETVTKPLEATGPMLLTFTLYLPVEPRTNDPTCDLAIVRSGAWPVIVTLALSLVRSGSVSFSAVLVAVFVSEPVVVTVAVRLNVTEAPLPIAPMFHTPVPLVYVPCEGTDETYVSPAGSWSVTTTPLAFEGPLLVTVIVNVTFEPAVTVPLLAILATAMSACETIVVESDAESFAVLISLPPATVAVFVSGLVAAWLTVTAIVIAGYEAPAPSASERVQVTAWPAMPHVQPVPDAVDGASPAGSVSETVTKPLEAAAPMLLTVRL